MHEMCIPFVSTKLADERINLDKNQKYESNILLISWSNCKKIEQSYESLSSKSDVRE